MTAGRQYQGNNNGLNTVVISVYAVCLSPLTNLHHILYAGCPPGEVVRLLLGSIPSGWFTREETGLEAREPETTMTRRNGTQWKVDPSLSIGGSLKLIHAISFTSIRWTHQSVLSTYRCDDGDSQFLPVQDKLSLLFDLHMLDEFAQILICCSCFTNKRRKVHELRHQVDNS